MRSVFEVLMAALGSIAFVASAADADRGKLLYEARCDSCHDQSVHSRGRKAATNFEEVRKYVQRWNINLGGAWGEDEITDVAIYLNGKYYSYKCPETVCRVTSQAGSPLVALEPPNSRTKAASK
jgi:mono/diheme cytochrome c family protein